jgi:hypothetical protein
MVREESSLVAPQGQDTRSISRRTGMRSSLLYPILQENFTLIKKKIKFSSSIRKFRMEQLQSHID